MVVDSQRNGGSACLAGTSHLVRLYEEKGEHFLGELNGSFAGLLIDLRKKKAILFNDRYGLGRIYYHESSDGFFFASEAEIVLAVLPGLRSFDQRSLAEFYSVGCVLQNRSLFKGVSLLPGGSQWTFHRDGRIERQRYFDPRAWEEQEPLNAHGYTEELTEVFRRVAPRYLQGPSAVGMSLTGDSTVGCFWRGLRLRRGVFLAIRLADRIAIVPTSASRVGSRLSPASHIPRFGSGMTFFRNSRLWRSRPSTCRTERWTCPARSNCTSTEWPGKSRQSG